MQKITVLVEGKPIKVAMHPPTGTRKSWYAFWTGLTTSKSTGQSELNEAVKVVENMLRNGGKKSDLSDLVVSDEEFEEIQRRHYAKKTDPQARKRSMKSLRECLDAISAFRAISGLRPITLATPNDCERFQRDSIAKPKNWRVEYAGNNRSVKRRQEQGPVKNLSSNTVLKWSVALQAAFERACHNAGKKCVRGVVDDSKLLKENPWRNFTWIEGGKKPLRQFDHNELTALLDYLESTWPGLRFAPAFVKLSLWSWARKSEVSSLRWSDERQIFNECHFESTGKWGVTKWFRIPDGLRAELEAFRTGSEFVFGDYPQQLQEFYRQQGDTRTGNRVRADFTPDNLGEWMYRQISEWSKTLPNGSAYLHVFRKTTLQYALSAGHIEQSVADDASISSSVLMSSYARIADQELRHKSNRTYQRIRSSLSLEVATRYGWEGKPTDRIVEQLDQARHRGDWDAVARLAEELTRQRAASEMTPQQAG